MRLETLGEMVDRVRQRADLENSDFLTNTEIKGLLSTNYADLVELIAKASPGMFESTQEITADGTTDTYAVTEDHYKTQAIEYGTYPNVVELPQLTFEERNSGQEGWRLVGYAHKFYPPPPAGRVLRVIYIPAPADLTDLPDSQVIDGIAGYEELLVVMTARDALVKQNKDVSVLERREAQLRERIQEMIDDRSPPMRISSTRDDSEWGCGYPWPRRGY